MTVPPARWPKVMTVVGTRPEIIKLSRVIPELDRHADHVLVHTGQNYDPRLSQIFFDELGLRVPDHHLDAARDAAADTIAEVIRRTDALFAAERPDAVVIYGDTNSGLCAIPAKRRHIPIFHFEAGNRCFDFRVPEEVNRRIIDHLSDVNLVHSEHARRYLLDEGLPPDRVIKTGSPMAEVLAHHRDAIAASPVLSRLGLGKGGYFVASAHREENVDRPERLATLLRSLAALHREFGRPVIVSVHPRTRRRLEGLHADVDPGLVLVEPFGFLDYIHLQANALCVVSDSGTLTEEAAILNFPAVMIRNAHERPEGMDEATVVMSSIDPGRLPAAVRLVVDHAARHGRPAAMVPDYAVEQVSLKAVRLILGLVDRVRREVWREGE